VVLPIIIGLSLLRLCSHSNILSVHLLPRTESDAWMVHAAMKELLLSLPELRLLSSSSNDGTVGMSQVEQLAFAVVAFAMAWLVGNVVVCALSLPGVIPAIDVMYLHVPAFHGLVALLVVVAFAAWQV